MQRKISSSGKLMIAALLTLTVTLLLSGAIATTLSMPSSSSDSGVSEQAFHFAVLSGTPVGSSPATATEILVLSGAGSFDKIDGNVEASGSFNIVNNTTPVPQTILDQGTWHSIGFVSFSQIGTFGQITAGILVITVEFESISGTSTTTTMRIVCNAPQGGFLTGSPEGVTVTLDGNTFAPTSPNRGITLIELTAG